MRSPWICLVSVLSLVVLPTASGAQESESTDAASEADAALPVDPTAREVTRAPEDDDASEDDEPVKKAAPVPTMERWPGFRPLLPAPAPRLRRFAVTTVVQTTYVHDPSFDLVSSADSSVAGGFWLRYSPFQPELPVALEVGWSGTSASAKVFQTFDADLSLHSFRAGAVWLARPFAAGRLFARGGLLLDLGRLSLKGGSTLTDTSVGGGAEATAGWELGSPERGFLLSLEVGYGWHAAKLRFSEMSSEAPQDKPAPIAHRTADAGSLDVSGVVWRIAGGYRF